MTNKEAIETLKANYPDACFEQLREAVVVAIFALEKQISMNVRIVHNPKYGYSIICPNCNRMDVGICPNCNRMDVGLWNYCPSCGQALAHTVEKDKVE